MLNLNELETRVRGKSLTVPAAQRAMSEFSGQGLGQLTNLCRRFGLPCPEGRQDAIRSLRTAMFAAVPCECQPDFPACKACMDESTVSFTAPAAEPEASSLSLSDLFVERYDATETLPGLPKPEFRLLSIEELLGSDDPLDIGGDGDDDSGPLTARHVRDEAAANGIHDQEMVNFLARYVSDHPETTHEQIHAVYNVAAALKPTLGAIDAIRKALDYRSLPAMKQAAGRQPALKAVLSTLPAAGFSDERWSEVVEFNGVAVPRLWLQEKLLAEHDNDEFFAAGYQEDAAEFVVDKIVSVAKKAGKVVKAVDEKLGKLGASKRGHGHEEHDDHDDGEWITLKGAGGTTHICINHEGKITKGPKDLVGRGAHEALSEHHHAKATAAVEKAKTKKEAREKEKLGKGGHGHASHDDLHGHGATAGHKLVQVAEHAESAIHFLMHPGAHAAGLIAGKMLGGRVGFVKEKIHAIEGKIRKRYGHGAAAAILTAGIATAFLGAGHIPVIGHVAGALPGMHLLGAIPAIFAAEAIMHSGKAARLGGKALGLGLRAAKSAASGIKNLISRHSEQDPVLAANMSWLDEIQGPEWDALIATFAADDDADTGDAGTGMTKAEIEAAGKEWWQELMKDYIADMKKDSGSIGDWMEAMHKAKKAGVPHAAGKKAKAKNDKDKEFSDVGLDLLSQLPEGHSETVFFVKDFCSQAPLDLVRQAAADLGGEILPGTTPKQAANILAKAVGQFLGAQAAARDGGRSVCFADRAMGRDAVVAEVAASLREEGVEPQEAERLSERSAGDSWIDYEAAFYAQFTAMTLGNRLRKSRSRAKVLLDDGTVITRQEAFSRLAASGMEEGKAHDTAEYLPSADCVVYLSRFPSAHSRRAAALVSEAARQCRHLDAPVGVVKRASQAVSRLSGNEAVEVAATFGAAIGLECPEGKAHAVKAIADGLGQELLESARDQYGDGRLVVFDGGKIRPEHLVVQDLESAGVEASMAGDVARDLATFAA